VPSIAWRLRTTPFFLSRYHQVRKKQIREENVTFLAIFFAYRKGGEAGWGPLDFPARTCPNSKVIIISTFDCRSCLCELFRPCVSLDDQFCACSHLAECRGRSCAPFHDTILKTTKKKVSNNKPFVKPNLVRYISHNTRANSIPRQSIRNNVRHHT